MQTKQTKWRQNYNFISYYIFEIKIFKAFTCLVYNRKCFDILLVFPAIQLEYHQHEFKKQPTKLKHIKTKTLICSYILIRDVIWMSSKTALQSRNSLAFAFVSYNNIEFETKYKLNGKIKTSAQECFQTKYKIKTKYKNLCVNNNWQEIPKNLFYCAFKLEFMYH